MSFLDDLPGVLSDALGEHFRDCVLERDVPGFGGTTYDPSETTTVSFTCKAIHDEWGSSYRANNLVKSKDWKILVLAQTLDTEPMENDRVTIEGVTLVIYSDGGQPAVTSDPAVATWELRCRT